MHLFQPGLEKCAKESVIRKIFGNLFVKRDSCGKNIDMSVRPKDTMGL